MMSDRKGWTDMICFCKSAAQFYLCSVISLLLAIMDVLSCMKEIDPATFEHKGFVKLKKITGCQLELTHPSCSYFAQNGSLPPSLNNKVDSNLEALFAKYRDATNDEKDTISVDGTMAYLLGLGVNLEDASSLIPLEIIQAPALGEMSKDGFIKGWKAAGQSKMYDDIKKQQAFIAAQVPLLSTDMGLFKRVYKHTFICSKDRGAKALPLENAIIYWQMLFATPGMKWTSNSTNWLDLWLEYLQAKWTRSVNRDMWNQTFEFFQRSMQDEQMSFWSEDGAWPGVIDDFVLYVKEKRGPVTDKMETD